MLSEQIRPATIAATSRPWPASTSGVSATPADTAKLADRGRIAPGLKADLLRVAVVAGRPFLKTVWRDAERVM